MLLQEVRMGLITGATAHPESANIQWSTRFNWLAKWVSVPLKILELISSPNGTENAELTTGFLEQLATFFSQPRYKNIVTMVSLF